MEKVNWKTVRHNDKGGHLPNLRWGHSCVLIDDQVVFFGGYADSNYMNDLWSFNTITMEWNQISTVGDIPSHRSNCTMHYDKDNDRLILFGGGGANKQRFNSINILDWKTKQWIQISPKQNESAPWARTYHSAELFYPYLVIYGGQGVSDLDDLWIFNFLTISWTQVPISTNATRPCPRRFHSSAKVGTQFFVIAGCYSKYRCLSDIYSIDLKSFLETGSVEGLTWKERKMKDNTFLTRWGHTSTVYDDKIYIFGGRFCNDLNDILVADPQKDTITTARVYGELPKARRRHSACFLGNSMLIFGGFNGQYFNDLHYINFPTPKKKFYLSSKLNMKTISQLQNIKTLEWTDVYSKEGKILKVCKGLIAPRFLNQRALNNFLKGIDQILPQQQLNQLIQSLYKGYGSIDNQLLYHYGINLYQSKQEMSNSILKQISQEERQSIVGNRRVKAVESVVLLQDYLFNQYLQKKRNAFQYHDVTFNLKNECFIASNKALLAINSQYFRILVSGNFLQNQPTIPIPFSDSILFQVLINFLTTGFVVTSKIYGHQFWVMLAQMSQYYSLKDLLQICEHQLINKINQVTCHELLIIGLQINLSELSRACAQQIIRNMINQQKEEITEIFPQIKNQTVNLRRQFVLKQVYSTLRFDILQKKIDTEQKQAKNNLKKVDSANNQNSHDQKQNNQLSH